MSLYRFSLLLSGLLGMLLIVGCVKNEPTPGRPGAMPRPAASATIAKPTGEQQNADALAVVKNYLQALQEEKFDIAYDMLSQQSQSKHPAAEFAEQGKREMPSWDLKSVKTMEITAKTAVISVQQTEDPATHGFNLTREGEKWKIVYWGGAPGMPYPEKSSEGVTKGDAR